MNAIIFRDAFTLAESFDVLGHKIIMWIEVCHEGESGWCPSLCIDCDGKRVRWSEIDADIDGVHVGHILASATHSNDFNTPEVRFAIEFVVACHLAKEAA